MSSKAVQEQMLDELQKIREAVSKPPPTPPPPEPPKGFTQEFMAFLNKYGIIGLAIAFIIGGAAGRLITALVSDIIMPVITFFVPGGEWRTAELILGPITLAVGDFFGTLIDFIIIALVVYLLSKQLSKTGLK